MNLQEEKIEFLRNQNQDLVTYCGQLKKGLKQCVRVLREWHGPEAFEIYYDHSPEMAQVRKVLPGFRVKIRDKPKDKPKVVVLCGSSKFVVEDLEGIIYWLSAARTDLEGISRKARLCPPEELIAHALEMIEKVDACASRVLLGENR